MNKKVDVWEKSPITGREMVLCENDDKNGESKMDLSSGYYTNEYPLNYKKHPDFDISKYEEGMPDIIKDLRHDDGESYWYPATIQTMECMVFPVGTVQLKDASTGETTGDHQIKWCYAPVSDLTEEELREYAQGDFNSKVNMEKAEYFVSYLEACKKVKGFALGNI
tara:strand:+ start:4173 stop:4670 length:498 start_codon:yes stop_codon:yes gene_type:complete